VESSRRMKQVCGKVIYRLRNMCVARCFGVWVDHVESSRRMKQVCGKVIYRLRNMCVARCFGVWVDHVESSRRMKQSFLRISICSSFHLSRRCFTMWRNSASFFRHLLVSGQRVFFRSCSFSIRFHFRHWSSLVSHLKRVQIESVLSSLENEFSRMRVIQDEFSKERQCLEQKVVDLENQVSRSHAVEMSLSSEAHHLATLNDRYMKTIAQYHEWQREFEGFIMTDCAINRLRAHGLKLPQVIPGFVSPPHNHMRSSSSERNVRSHTSPNRYISSPSDAQTPHTSSSANHISASSAYRHSNIRRVGGGFNIDN
jgi:Zn-finger nucleic acid-binding protein